jgi:hypothetical protein
VLVATASLELGIDTSADPTPLSVEDILKETINVTREEICGGLNELFDKGLVQPAGLHPRNADVQYAALTACGHLYLRNLVTQTLAEVLMDDYDENGERRKA